MAAKLTLKHWQNTNVYLVEGRTDRGQILFTRFCDRKQFCQLANDGCVLQKTGRLVILETANKLLAA